MGQLRVSHAVTMRKNTNTRDPPFGAAVRMNWVRVRDVVLFAVVVLARSQRAPRASTGYPSAAPVLPAVPRGSWLRPRTPVSPGGSV